MDIVATHLNPGDRTQTLRHSGPAWDARTGLGTPDGIALLGKL
jgi:hypothetical protein